MLRIKYIPILSVSLHPYFVLAYKQRDADYNINNVWNTLKSLPEHIWNAYYKYAEQIIGQRNQIKIIIRDKNRYECLKSQHWRGRSRETESVRLASATQQNPVWIIEQ